MFLTKLAFSINKAGFSAFLFLFGIALYVGRFLYKVIGIPVLWMLYQLSKILPDDDTEADMYSMEWRFNDLYSGIANFIDTKIFKQPELECEKWLKEHPEFK